MFGSIKKHRMEGPLHLHIIAAKGVPKGFRPCRHMPIVSSTDWVNVNVRSSSENSLLSAKIQILLAIGTSDQLDNLKRSRRITIVPSKSCNVEKPCPAAKKTNQTALADMLSNFIDNLALSLPKRSESELHPQCPPEPRFQLRRTSDLLDVLQNALKHPPQNLITSHLSAPLPLKVNGKVLNTPSLIGYQNLATTNVRALITIDSARNIVQPKKQTSEGLLSRNANFDDDKTCTYVSFEATNCDKPDQLSKHVTNIVQYNCNPHWNKQFDIMLPAKLFQQSKDLILKVWRKTNLQHLSSDANQIEDDELVGCSVIDLTPLSSGMKISGYHNIIDDKDHVNGQLKINIVPMNDIECQENNKFSTEDDELPNSFKELENGAFDVDNIMLSRTLKRKFTELEEISQRLKSRLLDVTADDNFDVDVDDEFENDLNTCPEDEDENDSKHQFDWNRFSALEIDCNATDEENVNRHFDDVSKVVVDRVDLLTNASQHSVMNISSDPAVTLAADENLSANLKTHD